MIPWVILAVIAVPLVVIGYAVMRRNAAAGDLRTSDDVAASAEVEQEFAEAEAYEAKWHEQDKEKYRQERMP